MNKGKVTQVIGPVVDVNFEDGQMPNIYNAIEIPLEGEKKLVVETMQHLGDNNVRCIAMDGTEGLVRGMEAIDTGNPISVPVGTKTLGRLFNVLGESIDGLDEVNDSEKHPIHREPPVLEEQDTSSAV